MVLYQPGFWQILAHANSERLEWFVPGQIPLLNTFLCCVETWLTCRIFYERQWLLYEGRPTLTDSQWLSFFPLWQSHLTRGGVVWPLLLWILFRHFQFNLYTCTSVNVEGYYVVSSATRLMSCRSQYTAGDEHRSGGCGHGSHWPVGLPESTALEEEESCPSAPPRAPPT